MNEQSSAGVNNFKEQFTLTTDLHNELIQQSARLTAIHLPKEYYKTRTFKKVENVTLSSKQ